MAVDEGSRHRLYRKLDQVLGTDEAGTLMRLLPPAGSEWSQLDWSATTAGILMA